MSTSSSSKSPRGASIVAAALALAAAFWVPGAAAQYSMPTRNVDEPGRQPYNEYIEYSDFGCGLNCSDFNQFGNTLLFNGPAVPAGKRLVVRWVSGTVPSTNGYNAVSFQETTIIANQRTLWQFQAPFYPTTSAATIWAFNQGAFFTVEPGEPLRIRVQAGNLTSFVSNITVGGYLIDAN